jgi:hypothetical protein
MQTTAQSPASAKSETWGQPFLPVILLGTYLYGLYFYWTQNKPGVLGGPVTLANALWLTTAIAGWYVFPAAVWLNRRVPEVLRRIYGWYFACWVVRAVVESYMLWGPRSWKPPYGISFDLAMILLVAGYGYAKRNELRRLTSPWATALKGYLVTLGVALACEMLFAWLFVVAVNFQTHFLWFADESPRFAFLNPLMGVAVVAVNALFFRAVRALYR